MSIKIGNNIVAKSSTYHPDLFDVKWSDHILDNISWLRADTFSWHSGELYNKAYEHLLEEWNEVGDNPETEIIEGIQIWYRLASDGHKICTKSQEDEIMQIYEATGVAWYYIIDTDNHKFKLPRTKYAFTGVRNNVGKFVEAGLPDHTHDLTSRLFTCDYHSAGNNCTYEFGSSTSQEDVGVTQGVSTNSIYGNSNTVQPKATEMYLYFYVGNFAQNDLQNVAGGIQDKDTAVNYDNITNCITHIPQDIKLELNNGVLTIKAGSKVYYPDGFESDGITRKFGYYITPRDIDVHIANDETGGHQSMWLGLFDGTTPTENASAYYIWKANCYSGDTAPSNPDLNWAWYDTVTNHMKVYYNNAWQTECNGYKFLLPICLFTPDSNHTVKTLDQVFNGFGYIGDEFYVLPSVKYLMPDGRNTDGSLKSIEFTTNKVNVCHDCDRKDPMHLIHYHKSFFLYNDGSLGYANFYWQQKDRPDFPTDPIDETLNYWYNTETNQMWYHRETTEEIRQCACVGQYLMTSNGITNFEPKQVFSVVDYSDVKTTIFSAFEPDYSNPVTISSSGYKVTRHGWIITTISSSWDSSSDNGKVFVNNVLVASNTHTDGTTGKAHRNTFMFPVWVGNIITYTGNIIDIKLYPLK